MASLDVEHLTVESFETLPEDGKEGVSIPRTDEFPNCYSPLCIPTTVKPNCDTATNPI
jgi:hypothetical protein